MSDSIITASNTSQRAKTLYENNLVWDAHAGVFPSPEVDLSLMNCWADNNVNYISMNVGFDVMDWQQTLATLAAYRRWILSHNDQFILVNSTSDILEAKNNGKLAVGFDIEGMNALNRDINMVELYHSLGVRQMLFAYNLNNDAAGGCHDKNIGLTDFGREIVREMNRVGIIVDCSHASFRTTMDIMDEATKPVVFSHSNPLAICDHQRNIRDEQIKACADTGGVIGMNGMGIFLGDNDVRSETIVKHIRYIADLVGPEHIGLGFDFSPDIDIDIAEILRSRPDFWPAGQKYDTKGIKHTHPAQIPEIVDRLCDAEFSDDAILGIVGENFRRIAAASWDGVT